MRAHRVGDTMPDWAKDLKVGKEYDCWYDQAAKLESSCTCQNGSNELVRGLLFAGQRLVCASKMIERLGVTLGIKLAFRVVFSLFGGPRPSR